MPFFVVVHYEAQPDALDGLLTAIKSDFDLAPNAQHGRRFSRAFQHLDEPARLLEIDEWLTREDFERHQQATAYQEVVAACIRPPTHEIIERRQHYRHLPHRPLALACTSVSASPDDGVDAVEAYIYDDERADALATPGLAIRAVYRVVGAPGRLLVLHGWRSRDDLDRYLNTSAKVTVAMLQARGAAVDQFAGQIAAEFSWLDG